MAPVSSSKKSVESLSVVRAPRVPTNQDLSFLARWMRSYFHVRSGAAVNFAPAVFALRLQPYVAWMVVVLAGVASALEIFGYDRGLTLFYGAGNGPHPLSLLMILLCGLSLNGAAWFRMNVPWRRALMCVVFFLSMARFAELSFAQRPLISDAVSWLFGGYDRPGVETGTNTALSLAMFSLGALVRAHSAVLGMSISATAMVPISFAILGYSFGSSNIYGAMSPVSLVLLTLCGIASLCGFARTPLLRPLLTGSSWGRMARLQCIAAMIGIWCIGAMVKVSGRSELLEVVLGSAMWIFSLTLLVSGPTFERIERERRRLAREMSEQAQTDPLTGLLNRFAVRDYVTGLRGQGPAAGGKYRDMTVGVIVIDIDWFKRINDAVGHDIGDQVLRKVGDVMRAKLRPSDLVARWGGEEFLILMPGTSTDGCLQLAERIRISISEEVHWMREGGKEPVTVSAGVAMHIGWRGGTTLEQSIQQADTALYLAKRGGRNCVIQFEDSAELSEGDARPIIRDESGQRSA